MTYRVTLSFFAQFDVYFQSPTDLEHEFELGTVLEVEFQLLVARHQFSQGFRLAFVQVVHGGAGGGAVGFFGQHPFPVHLVDDAHRHHTGPESRHVGFFAVVAERFVHGFSVIGFVYGHFHHHRSVVKVFSYDVHLLQV